MRHHCFERIEPAGDFRHQIARYRFRRRLVVELGGVNENGLLPRVDSYEQSAILSAELLRIRGVSPVTLGAAFHGFFLGQLLGRHLCARRSDLAC